MKHQGTDGLHTNHSKYVIACIYIYIYIHQCRELPDAIKAVNILLNAGTCSNTRSLRQYITAVFHGSQMESSVRTLCVCVWPTRITLFSSIWLWPPTTTTKRHCLVLPVSSSDFIILGPVELLATRAFYNLPNWKLWSTSVAAQSKARRRKEKEKSLAHAMHCTLNLFIWTKSVNNYVYN